MIHPQRAGRTWRAGARINIGCSVVSFASIAKSHFAKIRKDDPSGAGRHQVTPGLVSEENAVHVRANLGLGVSARVCCRGEIGRASCRERVS